MRRAIRMLPITDSARPMTVSASSVVCRPLKGAVAESRERCRTAATTAPSLPPSADVRLSVALIATDRRGVRCRRGRRGDCREQRRVLVRRPGGREEAPRFRARPRRQRDVEGGQRREVLHDPVIQAQPDDDPAHRRGRPHRDRDELIGIATDDLDGGLALAARDAGDVMRDRTRRLPAARGGRIAEQLTVGRDQQREIGARPVGSAAAGSPRSRPGRAWRSLRAARSRLPAASPAWVRRCPLCASSRWNTRAPTASSFCA